MGPTYLIKLVMLFIFNYNQNVIVCCWSHTPPIHPSKNSSEFVDNFFSYPANRQIDKGKNITSLVEVIIFKDVFVDHKPDIFPPTPKCNALL